jgi:hypothetical protein
MALSTGMRAAREEKSRRLSDRMNRMGRMGEADVRFTATS